MSAARQHLLHNRMVVCSKMRPTFESSDSIHVEAVRCISHFVAIYLMAPPHVEMYVTFPGMVSGIEICELGEKGTRVFGVRVEENVVYDVVE